MTTFVAPSPADQAAVWALTQRLVSSWAESDADAFSRLFAEDGCLILPGVYVVGRGPIRDYMADAFTKQYKNTRVTGQPVNIKFLGDSAMVMVTKGGVLHAGETKVSDLRSIHATWLAARQPDGSWALANYQNCPELAA